MASVQKISAMRMRVTTIRIGNTAPDVLSIMRKITSRITEAINQLNGIRNSYHRVPRRSITVNARMRAGTFSGMRKKSGIAVRKGAREKNQ